MYSNEFSDSSAFPVEEVSSGLSFVGSWRLKPAELRRNRFIQIMGAWGTGARRLALEFAQPTQRLVWVSKAWSLYAPLLWNLSRERGADLVGIEMGVRKKFRSLCRLLMEAQIFDTWILDISDLKQADLQFLEKLLKFSDHPQKIIVLSEGLLSLCGVRVRMRPQGMIYKPQWIRGKSDSRLCMW